MSTLKVSEIRNASSATGGLSIAADGVVSGALPSPNRNLLYNGAMQVSQRGTSTTGITATGYYTADRWNHVFDSMGTWTDTIENDAPTGSGFRKSLKTLCTTADAAPAGGDQHYLQQRLEGQDVQRIRKGTASAEQLTLSFWVKSNVTGTYVVSFLDHDNTRLISASYSVSASATWEKKSITISGDTTGVLDNDNAVSLSVLWWLGAGTDRTSGTLATSWGAITNANVAVGQTNLAAATNNYWQVTGVQLEIGDTATEFEHLPFGVELARCQRYYWRNTPGSNYGTYAVLATSTSTAFEGSINLPTTLRANASSVEFSNVAITDPGTATHAVTAFTIEYSGNTSVGVKATVASSGAAQGDAVMLRNNNNSAGYVAFSAEL